MKIKVQAQHLKAGDIVGSGDRVSHIIINSIKWPSNKVYIELLDDAGLRSVLWGKYTMINVERVDAN